MQSFLKVKTGCIKDTQVAIKIHNYIRTNKDVWSDHTRKLFINSKTYTHTHTHKYTCKIIIK